MLHSWRGGRVAEGAPLLREYGLIPIEGSNPSLSAKSTKGGFMPLFCGWRQVEFEPSINKQDKNPNAQGCAGAVEHMDVRERPPSSPIFGYNPHPFQIAPVAQLDRVPGYEPGGRGFDSLRARQFLIRSFNRLRLLDSL